MCISQSHNLEQGTYISADNFQGITLQPDQVFITNNAIIHAGGEANPKNIPYLLHDGSKCFDVNLHAYITEGVNLSMSTEDGEKSDGIVMVEVVGGNNRKQSKPPHTKAKVVVEKKTGRGLKRKTSNRIQIDHSKF